MNIFMSILYFSAISLFILSTTINAMDRKDDQPLKQKIGLHKPVKQGPKYFNIIEPLKNSHTDKEGRVYYTSSKRKKTIPLKNKKGLPSKSKKSLKKKRDD